MSPEALGLIMLSLMVVAIMIGFPTAFTLMSLGITFGFLGMGFLVFDLAVQRVFFVMQNDVLVAIPLFLFMGYVIERAGILDELFHAVNVMFGWLPGSLAVATLATGTIFATATGIVGAAVTLLGLLACSARSSSDSPRRRKAPRSAHWAASSSPRHTVASAFR